MAMKRGLILCAAAGILVATGCSATATVATCATDGGARVCVTPKSTALRYDVEATGFQPNSSMQMVPDMALPEPHPMQLPIGANGTYGGALGMVGGPGTAAMMTLTFSGTAGSGAAVSIPVLMKR